MGSEQLTWRQRGWLWLRLGIRLGLFLLAVCLLWRFGEPLLALFAPFVFALIAAAILDPAVKWAQRRIGLSRSVLTMILVLLLLGLIGVGLGFLIYAGVSEVASLIRDWDKLLEHIRTGLDEFEGILTQLQNGMPTQVMSVLQNSRESLMDWLGRVVPEALKAAAAQAGQRAMGVPSFVIALVIFIMATYFLTADYPNLRIRIAQNVDEGVLHFFDQVRITALGAFGGYLKAEFLLSVGVFVILLVGFFFMRQPYALLLALLLAVMDFIPLIGAGTVMVPWAVIALITRDYKTAIELMIIWGIIALFRRVAEPKFVGDQTGLSPILSLIGIYVGMKVGGVLGMILGPILLLVLLNLAGMGIFHGLRMDLSAAAKDFSAILGNWPKT
jgi:sporulation integral membrane protein YtvI